MNTFSTTSVYVNVHCMICIAVQYSTVYSQSPCKLLSAYVVTALHCPVFSLFCCLPA